MIAIFTCHRNKVAGYRKSAPRTTQRRRRRPRGVGEGTGTSTRSTGSASRSLGLVSLSGQLKRRRQVRSRDDSGSTATISGRTVMTSRSMTPLQSIVEHHLLALGGSADEAVKRDRDPGRGEISRPAMRSSTAKPVSSTGLGIRGSGRKQSGANRTGVSDPDSSNDSLCH